MASELLPACGDQRGRSEARGPPPPPKWPCAAMPLSVGWPALESPTRQGSPGAGFLLIRLIFIGHPIPKDLTLLKNWQLSPDSLFRPFLLPHSFAAFTSPLSLFSIQIYLDQLQAFALAWMTEK